METSDIVHSLRRIAELKDEIARPRFLLNRTIADERISLDPDCTARYPSASNNTVAFIGTEMPISPKHAEDLVDVYRSRGVKRFFVFMSPSPWLPQNLEAITTAGLTKFHGPDYHTLVRNVSEPIADAAPCKFQILRLTPDIYCDASMLEPGARTAASRPEFDVWVAMVDNIVAGYGMATTLNSVTYLGGAATAEPYRNQGIQTALIRTRLQDAARRGSEIAASETLSMLGSSLRNLQRAGFTIAYDKTVYQYATG